MRSSALPWLAAFAVALLLNGPAHTVPLGQPCGGPGKIVCDKGLWCEPPSGSCKIMSGVCAPVPRFCFARKRTNSFRPVCGCNNKTYSNDCFRRAYRVPKSHDGKC
jgi:hypothetical protein